MIENNALTEKEEAEIRARDEKRRKEEEDRKRRAEEERKAEEKRQKEEKLRRLEEERRRLKQEEEWKRLGSDKILPYPPVPPSCLDDQDPNGLRAWWLDDETSKPVLRMSSLKPGRRTTMGGADSNSGSIPRVTLALLKELGVVYFRINLSDFIVVNSVVKERCYKHTDEIRVSQTCKDDSFLDKWFAEHFNDDEQMRLITDGSCFIDVRAKSGALGNVAGDPCPWIRLHLSAGDLLLLPAGMYHRCTLDENDYCSMMRLFKDSQRWAPVYRQEKRAEGHPSRQAYVRMVRKGNVAAELGFK